MSDWEGRAKEAEAAYLAAMLELEKVDQMAHKMRSRGIGGQMVLPCSICEAIEELTRKHGRPQPWGDA